RSAKAAMASLGCIDVLLCRGRFDGLLALAELAPAGSLRLLATEIAAIARLAVARRSLEMEQTAALELGPDYHVFRAVLLRLLLAVVSTDAPRFGGERQETEYGGDEQRAVHPHISLRRWRRS